MAVRLSGLMPAAAFSIAMKSFAKNDKICQSKAELNLTPDLQDLQFTKKEEKKDLQFTSSGCLKLRNSRPLLLRESLLRSRVGSPLRCPYNTFLLSYFLTFLLSHFLTFLLSYFLTFLLTHFLD